MHVQLIRTLCERGIIRENTEIEAKYAGVDLSGAPLAPSRGLFFVKDVKVNEAAGLVFFKTVSTVDGHPRTFTNYDLVKIDGMAIDIIGEVYGLDVSGNNTPQPKRRGRQPGQKKKKEATE